MHANKRERVDLADAGSIVGVVGLKDSSTGETLCDAASPVLLEKMEFQKPVISISVEPKTHSDQEKLDQVLEKLMAEDPTLQVKQDEDTGQTILSGMGELHLEIITSRMQREFNTNVNIGKPQVVYRETLAKKHQHPPSLIKTWPAPITLRRYRLSSFLCPVVPAVSSALKSDRILYRKHFYRLLKRALKMPWNTGI